MKKNLLRDYLQHPRIEAPTSAPQLALEAPPRHVVDMIVGGDSPPGSMMQVLHLSQDAPAYRFPNVVVSFSDKDYPENRDQHTGPLTVQLDISGQDVRKVLVDNGSSADIIFRHTLRRMILGGHPEGIMTIDDFPDGHPEAGNSQKWSKMARALPGEPTKSIQLTEGDSSRVICIGSLLEEPIRSEIIKLLRNYEDVFAWVPEDMPGLDEEIALHYLHIRPECKPVIQKRRILLPKDRRLLRLKSLSC